MTATVVPTFTATIYVGLKVRQTGEILHQTIATSAIQGYVDLVGLCVTVTRTQFIYTNGSESGLAIGLINYPRFPSSAEQLRVHAIAIAEILLKTCKQLRVSVVMPSETIMLSMPEPCAHSNQQPTTSRRLVGGVERVVFQCQDCLAELIYEEPDETSDSTVSSNS